MKLSLRLFSGVMVFLLAFGLAGVVAGYAQTTEPCLPDCPDDEWYPPYPDDPVILTVTLPCNEVVEVRIRYRKACGTWNDMYIEGIRFIDGYTAATRCGQSMTVREMIDSLTKIIFETYHAPVWDRPPKRGECTNRWRVMYGACWQPDFPVLADGYIPGETVPNPPPWYDPQATSGSLWPCEYQICCLDYYELCNVDGKLVATKYGTVPASCVLEPPQDPNCVPVCD